MSELYHYGIKGMKWGIRHDRIPKGRSKSMSTPSAMKDRTKKSSNSTSNGNSSKSKIQLSSKQKTALKVGAAAAATALAVYGGYKMNRFVRMTNVKHHIKEGEEKLDMWLDAMYDRSDSVQNKLAQRGLDAAKQEMDKARTDSFVTATRNTYNYLKQNRHKR